MRNSPDRDEVLAVPRYILPKRIHCHRLTVSVAECLVDGQVLRFPHLPRHQNDCWLDCWWLADDSPGERFAMVVAVPAALGTPAQVLAVALNADSMFVELLLLRPHRPYCLDGARWPDRRSVTRLAAACWMNPEKLMSGTAIVTVRQSVVGDGDGFGGAVTVADDDSTAVMNLMSCLLAERLTNGRPEALVVSVFDGDKTFAASVLPA